MNKLEQAREDHLKGNWQLADTAYEEILNEEPENADVLYMLATSKMTQNKLDVALDSIKKAIEINTQAPAFYQLKGSILARQGKVDDALADLETALKENPNLYQAQVLAGHIYYTKGIRKNSERHFRMAIKIDAKKPEAHINLAKLLIDEGDINTAINILRELEEKHPDQAAIKMTMGQAFIESGAYNYAENYFQQVLAMHPEYELAGLYLGITKLQTGDIKNAEQLIHTFNKQYKNTREGMAALGLLMFKQNNFQSAIGFFRNAIGKGFAPVSWRATFVESLAKIGQYQPAIDFYLNLEKSNKTNSTTFRLGELFELQGKVKKAKKQYKQIEKEDSKYIAAQLGLARNYLREEKFEKSEKHSRNVLNINGKHAEGLLLLLTTLLNQGDQDKSLKILESLNYDEYADAYKKSFRLQHGLILDNQEEYKKAYEVFTDVSKQQQQRESNYRPMSKQDVKTIAKFKTKIDDKRKEPVFIIGSQNTNISNFIMWLYKQGVVVLNDRMLSRGRDDILFGYQELKDLDKLKDEDVKKERNNYYEKVQAMINSKEQVLVADSMYINPYQFAIIKKIFPDAKVILLTRKEEDLELSEKAFGKEPLDVEQWNEAKQQIEDMELNLIKVNIDKWLENDKNLIEKLSDVFEKDLSKTKDAEPKYWQKNYFPKDHWKNYKKQLGK